MYTAEYCLNLIGKWVDPNPDPVIEKHDDFFVVRDDLLEVGTKARGGDFLIGHYDQTKHVQEWVYGSSPATGYAQMSLPYICGRYGKKAVIFMAQRDISKLHPYQKKAIDLGADMRWVSNGMLNVTEKRARDYVNERPETRYLIPIGLDHPAVIGCLIRVARSLSFVPDVVWSVGSSGTLSRSLQMAWPEAEVHLVSSGGRRMKPEEIGRAIFHATDSKFTSKVSENEQPPFPSVPSYDAKAWVSMKRYYRDNEVSNKKILFWNVGA
jgi:hypothetical protein